VVSFIPQKEMVVLAGETNENIGSGNVGYDGTHTGFGYGDKDADGSRILEFADGLKLVICNTVHEARTQLMTYEDGPVKSMVDYIIVQQEHKASIVMSRSFQMKNVYQSTNCL